MEYWNKESLFPIISLLAHSLKIDPTSLKYEYENFIRIYVEINITQPLK